MQPGLVGLRGGLVSAWEEDLRAVRLGHLQVGRGREALVFTQRFYSLISSLRPQIQRAWGPGGHVHVVDTSEIGGPGPRVSQSRIRLRNHGEFVSAELFAYANGDAHPNPAAGVDRQLRVVGVDPLALVTDLYRTAVDFLQVALNLDLALSGSLWLYEHAAVRHFVETGGWASAGEVYRRVTREFAVSDSFESVLALVGQRPPDAGSNGSNGHRPDTAPVCLTVEQLHRYADPQADLENLVRVVQLAVAADTEEPRITSQDVGRALGLDPLATTKLGRLLAQSPDLCREAEFEADFGSWSFLPSYNAHFFRRVNAIDDFLLVQASLTARAAPEGTTTTSPGGTAFKVEAGSGLPDGIVTFLMTDVVESTPLWIQSRASMYQAMRRHDQLITEAVEANGGVVLKERGEGDSFFAVFLRATDAVVAAVEAQRAIQSEPWPDRISMSVRMAVLTGEADSTERDYRSPAVNRCAKLRRRAVGNQILVSETTYSIVADILREDIQLISVGKRRLEGHDRPEEVYVVRRSGVQLEAEVAPDEVLA